MSNWKLVMLRTTLWPLAAVVWSRLGHQAAAVEPWQAPREELLTDPDAELPPV